MARFSIIFSAILLCGLTYGKSVDENSNDKSLQRVPSDTWNNLFTKIKEEEIPEEDAKDSDAKEGDPKAPGTCYYGIHEGWSFKESKLEKVPCPTEFCLKFAYKYDLWNDKYTEYACGDYNTEYYETCLDVDDLDLTGTICACRGNLCNGTTAIRANILIPIALALMAKLCIF